jgi:hypothetical protein
LTAAAVPARKDSEIAREDTRHYTCAALLIVQDRSRRRLVHFKLCAHLLQAGSDRLNLLLLLRERALKILLLLRCISLEVFLLLRDGRF